MEHSLDDIYFSDANQMRFKNCAASVHDGGSTGYPIGLAVADMSHLQHPFGKGYNLVLHSCLAVYFRSISRKVSADLFYNKYLQI